jgi:hypothetical protein
MGDTSERKRLAVYAIPETKEGEEKKYWPRIGAAFTNRDGSITLLLDALPLGTNRLQVREPREEARAAPGGNGAARRHLEEVRP